MIRIDPLTANRSRDRELALRADEPETPAS